MDMRLSSDDLAFQEEIEAFLDTNLDDELRRAGELSSGICGAHEPTMRWHRILHKKGWVAPRWPVEHGGTGWNDMQHYIWSSACARAHVLAHAHTRAHGRDQMKEAQASFRPAELTYTHVQN